MCLCEWVRLYIGNGLHGGGLSGIGNMGGMGGLMNAPSFYSFDPNTGLPLLTSGNGVVMTPLGAPSLSPFGWPTHLMNPLHDNIPSNDPNDATASSTSGVLPSPVRSPALQLRSPLNMYP
jgi:hypothetical protein